MWGEMQLEKHIVCRRQHSRDTRKFLIWTPRTKFHGGVPCLGDELGDEFLSHCLALEEWYFGLTMDDLCRLAFQTADSNVISHAFSKADAMAGKKWYYGL